MEGRRTGFLRTLRAGRGARAAWALSLGAPSWCRSAVGSAPRRLCNLTMWLGSRPLGRHFIEHAGRVACDAGGWGPSFPDLCRIFPMVAPSPDGPQG